METLLQYPQDLVLGVRTDTKPIEGLTVLSTRQVTIGNHSVTFRIIGESHWITVRHHGNTLLHEVLACVRLNDAEWQYVYPFREGFPHTYTYTSPLLSYCTQLKTVPFTSDIASTDRSYEHLHLDFPHPFGGSTLPFTSVWWTVEELLVRWGSTHVYPLEDRTTAVISESSMNLTR